MTEYEREQAVEPKGAEERSYAEATLRDTERTAGKSPRELEEDIEEIRAAMNSTLTAIERRLSPGDLFERYLHSVREGGGEYVSNLTQALRNNPVPSTLVGIGLGWLMLSGSSAGGRALTVREVMGKRRERMAEAGGGARESFSEKTGQAREKMHQVSRSVKDVFHRAGEKAHEMGDRAREMRDRARESGHSAGESVSGWKHRLQEKGSEWRHQSETRSGEWKERMSGAGHRTGERVRRAQGGFTDMIQRQPMMLGLLGIAAGALVGSMLPPTREEDEWFGEARDRLKERGMEEGRAKMEQVQQVAERAATAATDSAREEMSRQLH